MTESLAEECKRSAVERINKAIDSLGRIVVEHCNGYANLLLSEKEMIRDSYFTLIEVRDSLTR